MSVPQLRVPSRRLFVTGLLSSLIAAPAVVRVASLMPVKSFQPFGWPLISEYDGVNMFPIEIMYGTCVIRGEFGLNVSTLEQHNNETSSLFT